jgi:hypothetical protein
VKIYRIASKEFKYLGQCDRVRCDDVGENNWQDMIKNHEKVSMDEFIEQCDWESILDEDETIDSFIAADPTSYFAKSTWGNRECYYVMTHGFEFIFVRS